MRRNVPARKNCFEMPQELRIDRNYVFKVTVHRAILNHEDAAVALKNRGLDFTGATIAEDRDIFAAINNFLARFPHTHGTKRVGLARPAQRWFGLLPGLEEGSIGPARRERSVWPKAI